ncbi:MAG: hypothetical protein Q9166_002097 [cf. Caloplaca sp. 2 TL-2023]
MQHITIELDKLAATDNVIFIKNNAKPILSRLSMLLRRAKEDHAGSLWGAQSRKEELRWLKIWPMATDDGKTSKLVSSQEFSSDVFLFVPHRADLYELFRKKVPLLDFASDEIFDFQPLIEYFPSARLLSKEVQKELSYSANKSL